MSQPAHVTYLTQFGMHLTKYELTSDLFVAKAISGWFGQLYWMIFSDTGTPHKPKLMAFGLEHQALIVKYVINLFVNT